jgi:pseudaminic acid cytidylyltransferase
MIKPICIIPARGGSKRIPKKNIKSFNGKPIISYAIENAISSDIFSRIIVSTDDSEIAEISQKHGAEVPFLRSAENSNDHATTFDALREVIKRLDLLDDQSICCMYPCTPLITVGNLVDAYSIYLKSELNSLIPVIRFPHPIERALKVDEGGLLEMKDAKFYGIRTQDLGESYFDAGQFYFFSVEVVNTYESPFQGTVCYFELDPYQAQDVDNENDWKMLEFKFKLQNEIA